MIRCQGCLRHIHDEESTCPFCGTSARRGMGKLVTTMGAGVAAVILAACYGPPAGGWDGEIWDDTGTADFDEDGFDEGVDCDDRDADINPDADEICDDDIDNDCDDLIDGGDPDCAG